jgi:TaqI-like C-terminal specificity domain
VTGTSVADALAATGTAIPRARLGAGPWHLERRADTALADRLARRWPALADVLPAPSRGIVTGCNRAFVVDGATRARLDTGSDAAALVRPFLKGRDIRRWRAAEIDRYVLLIDRGTVPPPGLRAHLARFRDALEPGTGRKPGTYKWFELQDPVVPLAKSRAPRLFYQDIQTGPACCLDDTGELVPDTTVWILPTADRFVLAVLNSRLYGWYARRRFPPALNGAVRPKLAYLRRFPIAQPPAALRARIEALVEAQLADARPERDTELDELIGDAYELTRRDRARLTPARVEA